MIVFDHGEGRFNFRVAGIAFNGGDVLWQTAAGIDFWFLPGGRVEMLESAQDALRREIQEELGVTPTIGRLMWVAENFFALGGRRYHELGLYFAMELPASVPLEGEFAAYEPKFELRMRWIPVTALPHYDVRPAFLKEGLLNPPTTTQHFVVHEPIDQLGSSTG